MKAIPVPIEWHPDLSIFASEPFLKAVGDEYGWLGGVDDSGELRCILPYTVVQKTIFRMVRFRVETIHVGKDLSIDEERAFLNSVMKYFRTTGVGIVIPASNNTIFRTYPDGAIMAPYGSYIVDLCQPEETLWNSLHSKHRNVIRNAAKKGVKINNGAGYLDAAYEMIRDTLRRSDLGFMSLEAFKKFVLALSDDIKIFIADYRGSIQGCAVVPFSKHGAYYLYGGTIPNPLTGSMNLLQWEAMRQFSTLGIQRYDFVGARIDPNKGSKQEGLAMFKQRFGGELVQGYMWKYFFRPLTCAVYSLAIRLQRGGDIVDQERHKLKGAAYNGPKPFIDRATS